MNEARVCYRLNNWKRIITLQTKFFLLQQLAGYYYHRETYYVNMKAVY